MEKGQQDPYNRVNPVNNNPQPPYMDVPASPVVVGGQLPYMPNPQPVPVPQPYLNQQSATPVSNYPQAPIGGMFGRRIGRLGFFLGIVYLLVPLAIAGVVQLIAAHFRTPPGPAPALTSSGVPITITNTSLQSNSTNMLINIISVLIGVVTAMLVIPVSISLWLRRLHDLGLAGWLVLVSYVPFLGFLFYLYVQFAPGRALPNEYGPPIKSLQYLEVLGFKKPSL